MGKFTQRIESLKEVLIEQIESIATSELVDDAEVPSSYIALDNSVNFGDTYEDERCISNVEFDDDDTLVFFDDNDNQYDPYEVPVEILANITDALLDGKYSVYDIED